MSAKNQPCAGRGKIKVGVGPIIKENINNL